MRKGAVQITAFLCVMATLYGCASRKTFTTAARAGDTVSMAIGWYPHLQREDLTITLAPSVGSPIVYLPGDPAVRAVANLHADPLSRLNVERETIDTTSSSVAFAALLLESAVTNGDKEYSEKFIVLDLPSTIAEGTVNIDIQSSTGDVINPLTLEILPGAGSPNTFGNWNGWSMDTVHLRYMERAPYYTIDFTGTTVPHAIQIELAHNPDASSGGVGVPYVVSPRSDLKNAAWSDDGTQLRVILTPAGSAALADIKHFKFYVAGGLNGLLVSNVSAYDVNGGAVAGGIQANITAN